MWRLHRYYLRELTVNAAITFLVLFAVVLVSLIYRGVKMAQGGALIDAALITLYFALDAFPHLLTIAFLIASVLTFTRAAQDRELTALRAAGIPPTVPMTSAILVGILLSVLGSFTMHYVIPDVFYRKYRVISQVVRNTFVNLNLGTDRIKILDTGYVMTYRRRDAAGEDYLDCMVYGPRPIIDSGSPVVFVDRVSMPRPAEGDESLRIRLDGVRDPYNRAAGKVVDFDLSLQDIADRHRRDDRDADLRSDQLLSEVLRGVHGKPFEAIYTLFRRCCFSLMPALLAPIGFCLAEMSRDRGRVFALVFSLVPLSLFYLGEVLGARLLLSTSNPLCAWLPAVFLLAFGVPLTWRQLRR